MSFSHNCITHYLRIDGDGPGLHHRDLGGHALEGVGGGEARVTDHEEVVGLRSDQDLPREGEEDTPTALGDHVEHGLGGGSRVDLHGQADHGVRLVGAGTPEDHEVVILEHFKG